MLRRLFETNRARLLESLRQRAETREGAVVLRGHRPVAELDATTTHAHMQFEANFTYLFGAQHYHYDGVLFADGRAALLADFPPGDHASTRLSAAAAAEAYGVERVLPASELPALLRERGVRRVFVHCGRDAYTDAPSNCYDAAALEREGFALDRDSLYPALNNTRAIKSAAELELMERVCMASSAAHEEVMRRCRPGMTEHQLGAVFFAAVSRRGDAGDWAYWPICCSGADCAVLHYHANDKPLADGVLALCDLGAKLHGVCADITTTFPVNGRFSPRQAQVYQLCLEAQLEGVGLVREGVRFADVEDACFRRILAGLRELGLVLGEVEPMFERKLHATFMPHSLGHYIGFKTHDVGLQRSAEEQRAAEERQLRRAEKEHREEALRAGRDPLAGLEEKLAARRAEQERRRPDELKKYLPLTQAVLRAGMAITVEPGVYFIDALLRKAREGPDAALYDFDKIDAYRREVGGVRIEDCVAVTPGGHRALSRLPRSVAEIEALMAEQALPLSRTASASSVK